MNDECKTYKKKFLELKQKLNIYFDPKNPEEILMVSMLANVIDYMCEIHLNQDEKITYIEKDDEIKIIIKK